MMRVTLRIVGECLFSTDPSHESSAIGPHVQVLLEKFMTRITAPVAIPLSWPLASSREVKHAIRSLHSVVDTIIAQRHEQGPSEHGDLLDMLMSAQDEETGERMSARQLRDEVLTILVAGHETTAAALAWTWSLLCRHPEIDERLGSELSALGPAPLGLAELERAPYVRQVIQESMRLYPPAWIIGRQCAEADEICGVAIPAGRLVFVSPYASHRRPEVFPDPERFDPDRFRTSDAVSSPFSKYEYFPFGAGPRICIGNGFAMMEAQLVLATLRRRFRLRLASASPVEPLPLLTLRCKGRVHVVADETRR
jgi:cytochrome P450